MLAKSSYRGYVFFISLVSASLPCPIQNDLCMGFSSLQIVAVGTTLPAMLRSMAMIFSSGRKADDTEFTTRLYWRLEVLLPTIVIKIMEAHAIAVVCAMYFLLIQGSKAIGKRT